ncbi:hypothetical protein ACFYNW_32385 [Streptomyces virginiae]
MTTTPISELMPFLTDNNHRKWEIAKVVREAMNSMTGGFVWR